MSKTVSLEAHKLKKAARRGFREWRRLFPGPPELDENTRIQDLPDSLLLFLCEDIPQSRVLIYDLLMGVYGLGSGYEFESLAPDQVGALLDPFFLLTDQFRFECLRRLGWAYPSPASMLPLVDLVLQIRERIPVDFLGTPELTPAHPAYPLLKRPSLLEHAVFLRRHLPEAVKEFRERIQKGEGPKELP
jgi:hypothetical protein